MVGPSVGRSGHCLLWSAALHEQFLLANLVHFFFIFSLSKCFHVFRHVFWLFLTLLYAQLRAQELHMDPNPKF